MSQEEKKGISILLVDDSEDARFLVAAYLEKTSHRVAMAGNGEEALQKFIADKYDMVLMDVQMPVMDGDSAVRAIRRFEHDNNLRPVSVIAMTAYTLHEQIRESLAAGCDDYICKPIRKSALLDLVARYTSKS